MSQSSNINKQWYFEAISFSKYSHFSWLGWNWMSLVWFSACPRGPFKNNGFISLEEKESSYLKKKCLFFLNVQKSDDVCKHRCSTDLKGLMYCFQGSWDKVSKYVVRYLGWVFLTSSGSLGNICYEKMRCACRKVSNPALLQFPSMAFVRFWRLGHFRLEVDLWPK